MAEFFSSFITHFWHYTKDIFPSLILGLVLSGIVHEIIPQKIIEKYLTEKGILPVIYVTAIGAILPVCCFGALPVAYTFRKKGVPLGPVLAFLVAAPATSVTAVLVTWKLMGLPFTLLLCAGVILMGIIIGIIGNQFEYRETQGAEDSCPMCESCDTAEHYHHKKGILNKIKSVLLYAFVDMPKEMGVEMLLGVVLAAIVISVDPLKYFIGKYLSGTSGYIFALVFGLIMYICSTASVPLACAFVSSGLDIGAAMVLLLAGPITSYGSMLIIKKEFGTKVLVVYLITISVSALILGFWGQTLILYSIFTP